MLARRKARATTALTFQRKRRCDGCDRGEKHICHFGPGAMARQVIQWRLAGILGKRQSARLAVLAAHAERALVPIDVAQFEGGNVTGS